MKEKRIENPDLLREISLQPCVVTLKGPCDPCHVTSVKAGGHDTRDNVMPLIHELHAEMHDSGWCHMARKYDQIRLWFLRMGRWDILSKLQTFGGVTGLTVAEKERSETLWSRLEKLSVGAGGEQWSGDAHKAINQIGGDQNA